MTRHFWITFCTLLIIAGCGKGTVETETPSTGDAKTNGTSASTPPEPVKPDIGDLPASIKHDAFEYYGLDNQKTLDLKMSANGVDYSGSATVELEKIEGEKAYFKVVRTGTAADFLGTDSLMVDSQGIHATGNTLGKLTPASHLAMPADLTPGKTWNVKTKLVQENGRELNENSVNKVEGIRDLKTKSGVEKALLISTTGDTSLSESGETKKMKSTLKRWFVKGTGLVKAEMTFTGAGQPSNTIVIELSK